MGMTNRYDSGNRNHTMTCTRSKCEGKPAHEAGRHLDQRSEHYDGPDVQLQVTSMDVRASAWKIVRGAPELTPEVVDLVTYIGFLEDRATACQVDRDRGIREAGKRALDCDAHGKVITGLEGQVAAFDASARKSEAGRLALLGFLHAVDQGLDKLRSDVTMTELVTALKAASKKAHAAHDRAWK